MSTIVTHLNPDLDAITSVWLLQRFMPGFSDAEVKFVPAGMNKAVSDSQLAISIKEDKSISSFTAKSQSFDKTQDGPERSRTDQQPIANSQFVNSQPANSQFFDKTQDGPERSRTDQSLTANSILWVDTGSGELDHHQANVKTCAAVLTWEHIQQKSKVKSEKSKEELAAVERLVNVVLRIDYNAEDITMSHASDDFFAFMFNERQILRGYRSLYRGQSDKHLEFGMQILDAIFETMKMKIEAEKVIENGIKFATKWGKGVGAETGNEMYMHLAQELGFSVVVSKDPKRGHMRIHAQPGQGIDFSREYEIFKKMDPHATWYLHPGLSLLLNGSSANPDMRPTKLGLKEIIEVLEKLP